jgi:uncharacterized OB-fold protein
MIQNAIPFAEGLKARKLLLPWCVSCGKPHFYPRSACPHCWSEEPFDWRPAAGTGVVHTFTIVRSNPPASFAHLLPYAIAIIDLDEGVRLLSNIVGEWEATAIGDRVEVEFVERDGEILPLFRRAV